MSKPESYTVPVWFLSFLTFIIVLILPWAAWMTKQNIEMGVKQTFIIDRLEKIEKRQEVGK